jgi:hypothetical protein
MKANLVIVSVFLISQIACCQDRAIAVAQYFESECNTLLFNAALYNTIQTSENSDTLKIEDYNHLIDEAKAFHFKSGAKKSYTSIGRVPSTPLLVAASGKNTEVYNKIIPLCKTVAPKFTNIYTLHRSPTEGRIEVIVLDPTNKVISGLVLLRGELSGKHELKFEQIKTEIKGDTFVQQRISETPEATTFQKLYKQRSDGYFEEIESKNRH